MAAAELSKTQDSSGKAEDQAIAFSNPESCLSNCFATTPRTGVFTD
jgi:hypothetical protein